MRGNVKLPFPFTLESVHITLQHMFINQEAPPRLSVYRVFIGVFMIDWILSHVIQLNLQLFSPPGGQAGPKSAR